MSKHVINLWRKESRVWTQHNVPADWSFGKCVIYCETYRALGVECYVEGDLVGELAAKAGISRAAAEIEYERPEWAA